jgi:hypothetical protein
MFQENEALLQPRSMLRLRRIDQRFLDKALPQEEQTVRVNTTYFSYVIHQMIYSKRFGAYRRVTDIILHALRLTHSDSHPGRKHKPAQ